MSFIRRRRRYWKIAPGEKGFLWVEQRDAGCIAVGWSATGDLRRYRTKGQLEKAFEKIGYRSRPNQLWRFYKDVLRDDKVVASSGKFVYSIGTIVGNYLYDENLVYKHSKPVRWELTFWEPLNIEELPLSNDLRRRLNLNRTILELSREEWRELEDVLTKSRNPFRNLSNWEGLCRAPQTEQEVVILFSKLTLVLRMKIEHIGTRFPDAYIRIKKKGRWITRAAEFEVNSSDFIKHGHLEQIKEGVECDYIICWKDDLEKKPKGIEIIELRKVLEQIV
ncbi:hypothetical protein DRO57_04875 [Candidatus Bathyarchaeota archaeon]|nr:MAG: hypothetical protein DRO57_04875 [Candidatus Bathyarchaeota archaeon]